ncbi:hypothetical protein AAV95_13410 [Mycolicibacterium elephantis]|uniref:hypothetical protein n=1 Tax=Mycolicibacterium elephantis TaxID=81858 RepID=UPI000629AFD0|nr:hypothetical protein [Mycolicibacterium elephantis]KKW64143.1 hypothetical protein AAV95_13410 [Mycolicibacterium elephantis]
MHKIAKLFATSTITAAGAAAAALALSATAGAQPAAPAPAPTVPGLPFIQQLASNPAAASQIMQGVTSLLGNAQAPAATATAPTATTPSATASVTLPQPPSNLPGMPAAPTAVPPTASAIPPQDLLTTIPTSLASLLPEGTPLVGLLPAPGSATAPAAVPTATDRRST